VREPPRTHVVRPRHVDLEAEPLRARRRLDVGGVPSFGRPNRISEAPYLCAPLVRPIRPHQIEVVGIVCDSLAREKDVSVRASERAAAGPAAQRQEERQRGSDGKEARYHASKLSTQQTVVLAVYRTPYVSETFSFGMGSRGRIAAGGFEPPTCGL
jgi:hypothetical protein